MLLRENDRNSILVSRIVGRYLAMMSARFGVCLARPIPFSARRFSVGN